MFVFLLEGILRKTQLEAQESKGPGNGLSNGELDVFIKSFPKVTSWKSERPGAVHQHNAALFAPTNNQSEHFKTEDKKIKIKKPFKSFLDTASFSFTCQQAAHTSLDTV